MYTLKELVHATNNFHNDNKIGEGGFGSVYIGVEQVKELRQSIFHPFLSQFTLLNWFSHFCTYINVICFVLHRIVLIAVGSETAQVNKRESWNGICSRGWDSWESSTQELVRIKRLLCRRRWKAYCLWLYAKPQFANSPPWSTRSRLSPRLATTNRHSHWFSRRVNVSSSN